jgi:hypothetical protein
MWQNCGSTTAVSSLASPKRWKGTRDASVCCVSHSLGGSGSRIRATVYERYDIARQLHRREFLSEEIL